jgi:ornithine--oxo-acid transaminase
MSTGIASKPTTTNQTDIHLAMVDRYSAHNYKPLPVVISHGDGVWVEDVDGVRYLDMLSAYSALNFGHRHPKIMAACREQMDRLTLTSRAFQNDQFGPFCKEITELTGQDMVLPMNSGAEGVETAIKTARKWGYKIKGVEHDKAEIICLDNNFHGRTVTIVSFSTDPQYKDGFGPFTPGFPIIPYGDANAFKKAINKNTVAILIEPIQGEGGIVVPPAGYLKACREICNEHDILFIADEIQTGLARTGKMFACDHEGVKPDLLILGKALGGGVFPVSAVLGSKEIMGVFQPGDHGSTFGGNPLACAIARAAMKTLVEEQLAQRAAESGEYLMQQLRQIRSPIIKEVRGKGLLIGIELKADAGGADACCKRLAKAHLLCKGTSEHVVRLAPPLTIERQDVDWAMERIRKVFADYSS